MTNIELKSRNILAQKRLVQRTLKENLLKRSLQMINANHCHLS